MQEADRVRLAAPLQVLIGEMDAEGLAVNSTAASEGGGRFRLTPVRLDKGAAALVLPGGRKLMYHSLHITDADGSVLEGTLTASGDRTLTIVVADAGARYPLTIDPTISDADWQAWNPGLPGANDNILALLQLFERLGDYPRAGALVGGGAQGFVKGDDGTHGGTSVKSIAGQDSTRAGARRIVSSIRIAYKNGRIAYKKAVD